MGRWLSECPALPVDSVTPPSVRPDVGGYFKLATLPMKGMPLQADTDCRRLSVFCTCGQQKFTVPDRGRDFPPHPKLSMHHVMSKTALLPSMRIRQPVNPPARQALGGMLWSNRLLSTQASLLVMDWMCKGSGMNKRMYLRKLHTAPG
jgi:hypothetical protein